MSNWQKEERRRAELDRKITVAVCCTIIAAAVGFVIFRAVVYLHFIVKFW